MRSSRSAAPRAPHIAPWFSRQASTFLRLAAKASGRWAVEDIHQLRVATRRLRAGIKLARQAHVIGAGRLKEELRLLGKALGEVRTLDVSILDAEEFGVATAALKRKRPALIRKLSPFLTAAKLADLKVRLHKAALKMRKAPASSYREPLLRLRRTIGTRAALPASFVGRHELRISMKKARYAIEAMGGAVGELKHLQEALGREHDLHLVETLVGTTADLKRDRLAARTDAAKRLPKALRSAKREILQLEKKCSPRRRASP